MNNELLKKIEDFNTSSPFTLKLDKSFVNNSFQESKNSSNAYLNEFRRENNNCSKNRLRKLVLVMSRIEIIIEQANYPFSLNPNNSFILNDLKN